MTALLIARYPGDPTRLLLAYDRAHEMTRRDGCSPESPAKSRALVRGAVRGSA